MDAFRARNTRATRGTASASGGAACVALRGGAGDGGDVVRERLHDDLVGEDRPEDLDVGAGVGDEDRGAAAECSERLCSSGWTIVSDVSHCKERARADGAPLRTEYMATYAHSASAAGSDGLSPISALTAHSASTGANSPSLSVDSTTPSGVHRVLPESVKADRARMDGRTALAIAHEFSARGRLSWRSERRRARRTRARVLQLFVRELHGRHRVGRAPREPGEHGAVDGYRQGAERDRSVVVDGVDTRGGLGADPGGDPGAD